MRSDCGALTIRGLILTSQIHRNRTSAQYKYSCPRFWVCTRCWRTSAIFHVPFSATRKTREETRYLGEQARYSPKRNCSNKEARSCRQGVSGSSLKRDAFSVTRAIDRGPLSDCRIGRCIQQRDGRDWINEKTCRYR